MSMFVIFDIDEDYPPDTSKEFSDYTADHPHAIAFDVHPAFVEAAKLLYRKSQDYGGGKRQDPAREEYHPLGEASYYQMLHTKLKRIENVMKKKQAGQDVNFESIEDSLIDLMNYSAFFWSFLHSKPEREK